MSKVRFSALRVLLSKRLVRGAVLREPFLFPKGANEHVLAAFQQQYQPVGLAECQFVQTIIDCYWHLNRIQELEYALYTYGHRQFESALADEPEETRNSMIVLQTHLTYQKELLCFVTDESCPKERHVPIIPPIEFFSCRLPVWVAFRSV